MPSADVEIVNPVAPDEIPAWSGAMAATFLRDPDGPGAARRTDILGRAWEPERAWGARAHGRWVATLRTEARTLSVPGPGQATLDIGVDALTNVTVAATHRRQGLMSRMLGSSLAEAHARGDAISILIAAEWPIYGRHGYAPATQSADYVLRRSRAGATCPGDPSRVRAVDREAFGDVASAVYPAARRRRAGQIDRADPWWSRVLGRDGFEPFEELPPNLLIHEGDDGPDGLLAWKASGSFDLIPPYGTVEVWDMATASDTAYRNLWSYLGGIDGIDEVRLLNRPIDEPVRWLLPDARTLVLTQQVDFLWLRLLDIAAALGARRYAVPGELVLEVRDEDPGGFAAGRYRLRADGDDVECRRSDADPDLTISQRTLASIYLGGFRLRQLALAGGATEHTPGAVDRLDVMCSTPLAPWNGTWF